MIRCAVARGGARVRTCALLGAVVLSLSVAAADTPAPRFPQGATSFQANCAVCHGAQGAGLPSLAPPLTSYPARYAASAEGRRQLAMTVLFGLFGDITVDDKHFDFKMPDFARLDDATLAATLNFVVFDLGHAPTAVQPLSAADIAAERAQPLEGAAVREHRKTVAPPAP
ncbi:MAG TPA: cytochrome c [Steroidobacteraceae bacterium]|nr:cytochrome c [Steroidobacteraceae bacterium]